jgi:DNA-binding CsgD family transcriptional regulator
MHLAMDSHDDRVPRSGTLSCPRPSGRCDYAVHVVPLAADTVEVGTVGLSDARAAVLIVIDDPDREPELNATVLRRQYALTGTESEVALRLAQGDRVELIAENFSVSITTVRTHLQHIFEKTGTHRQAELVRLLLS